MYDTILVRTDGSGPTTAALEYCAKLATIVDATVHVLHVADATLANGESLEEDTAVLDDARE